jgi:hypothetical protein
VGVEWKTDVPDKRGERPLPLIDMVFAIIAVGAYTTEPNNLIMNVFCFPARRPFLFGLAWLSLSFQRSINPLSDDGISFT